MKKILISLIHNNTEDRISYIKPELNKLSESLQEKYFVQFCDFSYQPEIRPVNTAVALLKDFMYWKIEREWNEYKKIKNEFVLINFLRFLKKILLKYTLHKHDLRSWKQRCVVEMYLTNKHIRAFKRLIEDEFDYLICFEDDTVFKNNSVEKLLKVIKDLDANQNKSIYIDLAGGCDIEKLGYKNLETKRDENYIYYSKPVTNTTCCYLTNTEQVIILDDILTRNPLLQYLNIDWFMNKLFILQYNKDNDYECKHTHPTIFRHGSVTGDHPVTY